MNARPYAVQMQRVLGSVAARVDAVDPPAARDARAGPSSRTLVIVVTARQGALRQLQHQHHQGRRACSSPAARSRARSAWSAGRAATSSAAAASRSSSSRSGIFQKLTLRGRAGDRPDGDRGVHLGRGRSRDADLQRVQVGDDAARRRRSAAADRARGASTAAARWPPRTQIDYLYEPCRQEIFNQLLPRYVEVQVYRALLESNAAFFAAQMTAMDTATKNSADMIASLTLYMNKVRQAAITREIIEVVSGARGARNGLGR